MSLFAYYQLLDEDLKFPSTTRRIKIKHEISENKEVYSRFDLSDYTEYVEIHDDYDRKDYSENIFYLIDKSSEITSNLETEFIDWDMLFSRLVSKDINQFTRESLANGISEKMKQEYGIDLSYCKLPEYQKLLIIKHYYDIFVKSIALGIAYFVVKKSESIKKIEEEIEDKFMFKKIVEAFSDDREKADKVYTVYKKVVIDKNIPDISKSVIKFLQQTKIDNDMKYLFICLLETHDFLALIRSLSSIVDRDLESDLFDYVDEYVIEFIRINEEKSSD